MADSADNDLADNDLSEQRESQVKDHIERTEVSIPIEDSAEEVNETKCDVEMREPIAADTPDIVGPNDEPHADDTAADNPSTSIECAENTGVSEVSDAKDGGSHTPEANIKVEPNASEVLDAKDGGSQIPEANIKAEENHDSEATEDKAMRVVEEDVACSTTNFSDSVQNGNFQTGKLAPDDAPNMPDADHPAVVIVHTVEQELAEEKSGGTEHLSDVSTAVHAVASEVAVDNSVQQVDSAAKHTPVDDASISSEASSKKSTAVPADVSSLIPEAKVTIEEKVVSKSEDKDAKSVTNKDDTESLNPEPVLAAQAAPEASIAQYSQRAKEAHERIRKNKCVSDYLSNITECPISPPLSRRADAQVRRRGVEGSAERSAATRHEAPCHRGLPAIPAQASPAHVWQPGAPWAGPVLRN